MKSKVCTCCKIEKPVGEFYNDKRNIDGKYSACKICNNKKSKKWRDNNIEYHQEKVREYYYNNKESRSDYNKEWSEKNKSKRIVQRKIYAKNNKAKLSEKYKKWYRENREYNIKRAKLYAKNNVDKIRKRSRIYSNKIYHNNIQHRIAHLFRGRINKIVNKGKAVKILRVKELIGCTPKELIIHLEKQFKPGMSWKNHSKNGWHIDHRLPCNSFDLTNPEEQKACFHFTNLQPLWAIENISKGHKIEYLL